MKNKLSLASTERQATQKPLTPLPPFSFRATNAKVPSSPSCETPDSPESASFYDDHLVMDTDVSASILPSYVKEEPEERLQGETLDDLNLDDLLQVEEFNIEALTEMDSFETASSSSGSHLDFSSTPNLGEIFTDMGTSSVWVDQALFSSC